MPEAKAIIGGSDVTDPNRFSWVGVFLKDDSQAWSYKGGCTGILIGPHTVLTARHCVWGYGEHEYVSGYRRMDRFGFGLTVAEAQLPGNSVEVNWAAWFVRPEFSQFGLEPCDVSGLPDLAVIALKDEAVYNGIPVTPISFDIVPVHIPSGGVRFFALGYGGTTVAGYPPGLGTLRMAQFSITGTLAQSFYTHDSNTGVAHGDSGGPAIWYHPDFPEDSSLYQLLGILSGGEYDPFYNHYESRWSRVDDDPSDPFPLGTWVLSYRDGIEETGPGNLDIDSDGVPFYEDNCPYDFNDTQLDDDGDGIGNDCDNCRFDWNPTQRNLDADAEGDACDPNMDGDSQGDTNNDGDGILDKFDCFPEHKFLNYDRDDDGICDDRVLQVDQAECNDVCDRLYYCYGYLTHSEHGACGDYCDPDDADHVLDNCIDVGDPQCQDSCTDVDDLTCRWARNDCKDLYYNPGQENLDGDDVGDQCDDEMMISELEVFKYDGPTLHGHYQVMSQCFNPKITVSFRALGPPGVLPLPMTIGACSCNWPTWDAQHCNPDCPPTEAHPAGNLYDYAWDAIHSTTGSSYDNWSGTDYTADGNDDNGYFADKSITFARSRADNLIVSSWTWLAHRESDFDPTSPYYYDFSIQRSIQERSLRMRIQFPPTPQGQAVTHGYVGGGWSVLTDTFDAAEMVGDTGCVTTYLPPEEVSPLRLIFWGPYRFRGDYWTIYDPYLLRKPTAYKFFQEPLTGDRVMVTHRTRTMTPSGIGKIQLVDAMDPGPSLDTASVAVAEVDTAAMGLGDGPEAVLFAYSSRRTATLHLGLVGREDNSWYRYPDVFPTGQEVPRFLGVSLVHSGTEQRLLLLGARETLEGPRDHSLVALNLVTGYFEDRGSLRLPSGLTNYSTVLDEAHARMIIFGGEIRGVPDKRVFSYDLKRRKLSQVLDSAPAAVARAEAGLAVDAEGNRLFVVGGRRGDQAVGDAWELNLVSAQWDLLGDGTVQGPGALRRPEVLYGAA